MYHSEYFYLSHDPRDKFDYDAEPLSDIMLSLPALNMISIEDRHSLDPLYSFPSEIAMIVLEYMPSADVCNLRLASRHVAILSQPSLLTQAFWSSRFAGSHEMSFVFANRTYCLPPEPVNWRELYTKAKAMLKDPRAYPGFQNRHRIWDVLSRLIPALSLRLENEESLAKAPYRGSFTTTLSDGSIPGNTVSGELTFEHGGAPFRETSAKTELDAGCRLFEKQKLAWPAGSEHKAARIGVSFAHMGTMTYITGLRLSLLEELSQEAEVARAGLVRLSSEQSFDLHPGEVIEALTVNMSITGIVGLRFDLNGPKGARSCTTGNLEMVDTESGLAKLILAPNMHCVGLLVGLDAWKLVSIQILEEPSDVKVARTSLSARTNDLQSAEIWNPNMPSDRPDWQHPEASHRQFFHLCLNMDFGGHDGVRLAQLTRVVAWMGDFPAVFLGMSFFYSDGTEQLYGRREYATRGGKLRSCVANSFVLAGARGELINRLETAHSTRYDTITEITVSTNFGRRHNFLLWGMNGFDERDLTRSIKQLPSDHAFTALYSKIQSPKFYFRDLTGGSSVATLGAVKVEALRDESSHHIPLTSDSMKSAVEMLAHAGGFAFTSANFSRIRRIRVSAGRNGYSRGPKHISGLWIDYEDSDVPLILGQWITECAVLEMHDDERLVEVTTWHDFTNRFSRVKFGPIVGISLVTSKGLKKEVLGQSVEGKVCLQYRENPYEKLNGIIWGFNRQWDHVRVLCSPRDGKPNTGMVFGPVTRIVPEWAVREKLFLDDLNADGSSDSVSVIEVSYKYLSSEPAGMTFTYESGKTHTIGHRGEKPNPISLQAGEELTAMEIGVLRGNRIGFMITSQNRSLEFAYDPDKIAGLAIHSRESHRLRRPQAGENPTARTRGVIEVPEYAGAGNLLGFWVIPRRQDRGLRYPMLGPIFEKIGGEQGEGDKQLFC
ncbi:uncharacterized protein BCR38DRAFT_119373 [Pseudomassariella vexata]|uniref:F-box domain-containing protein n=1 Tax=Pseudomassariella vexata TaxID=1141098 RepID=A0A1Y2D9X3_9PEZI|nr:uncharacterized protein BCR38DRAFT_119373 [Pseudomassariella vexata]ORY56063.1 hypothetical protein BCR38DRAFT_119373 [Pseudomassariella vexata]